MKNVNKYIGRLAFGALGKPLVWLAGNRWVQRLLAFNMHATQHLMGIGSGSNPETSGERVLFGLLTAFTAPSYTIFDVGANVGQFVSMTTAALSSSAYEIHAFEPSPAAYEKLQQRFGHTENIHCHELGLGAREGSVALYSDQPGSLMASMAPRTEYLHAAEGLTYEVNVSTIDGVAARSGIERIDLLKIDVEGFELDVLKGAEKMFADDRIALTSFEFSQASMETRVFFRDFYRFSREYNLMIHRITRSGFLVPIQDYSEFHEQFRVTNYVAFRC